jgi:peptidoglycan/LPS O-acetylase OafA/YrhL
MIPPRSPRYETLDAWRGLACLVVVLHHGWLGTAGQPDYPTADGFPGVVLDVLSKLWVGVPLFFVISGYCIASAADSARRRPHRGRSFFTRRFRRIYPPLWAFLAVCVLIHVVFIWAQARTGLPLAISHRDPFDVSLASWLGSATLTEEWRCHVVGPARDYFQWHLWTLCYEEQFYLVTGLAVVLAPRRLFAVGGAVSVVVFLILADLIRPPFAIDGFFFDGSWLEFAAGVLVYHRRNYASRFAARLIDLGLLAGLVWAARSVSGWAEFTQSVPAHLTAAFAGALLIGLGERYDGVTAKWRALTPLRWCGVRCYSLYLVHGPAVYVTCRVLMHFGWTTPTAILFGVVPVCTAVSLACGWAFHKFVEVHFLNSQPAKPSPPLTQTPIPGGKPAVSELARV